ncbi:hypothetical protein EDB81DRAFT_181692 [Dactylonectria macrodidyma]|uniref:Uncharacterized protein n=1 Tax=Dactylonectria macrodidyma TaxID=307937 RepID=A0A9P9JLT6_9HYPO|nr:hypothetical protein EDB81DRAFT_181692 [Dactylonectria macrodidyma]
MKSPRRHHSRHHRSRIRNRPPSFDEITKNRPAANSNGSFYVELWLNQVRDCQKEATPLTSRSDDGNYGDDYQQHKSSWQPHNLPVARIALDNRTKLQQKTRHFHDDLTIVTSPAGSRASASSDTRSHRAAKFTNHAEQKTRKRWPSEVSRSSLSRESVFEKRTRRKTRVSRYEMKKDIVQDDAKGRAKKQRSRALRHQLRSSRDVLDNFASAAISDKRLIMKTDLTAGLFLNGKSSNHPNKLSDLDFNNMSFLETREVEARKSKCGFEVEEQYGGCSLTNLHQDYDHVLAPENNSTGHPREARPSSVFDRSSSCNLRPKLTTCQPNGSAHATNHTEAKQAPQPEQLKHDNGGDLASKVDKGKLTIFSAPVDDPVNPQREPSTGSIIPQSVTASQTPENIRRVLIQSGVYDGTRVIVEPSRIMQRNPKSQDGQCVDGLAKGFGNTDPRPRLPTYEDKGTMVTPRLPPSRWYRLEPPSEAPIQHQEAIADADIGYLNQPSGLYSDVRLDTAQSQELPSSFKAMKVLDRVPDRTSPISFDMANSGNWFDSAPSASFDPLRELNGLSRFLRQDNVGAENINPSFWHGHTPSQPAPHNIEVPFSNHDFYEPSVTLDFSSGDGLSRRASSRGDGHKTDPATMGYHSLPVSQPWQLRNFELADEEVPLFELQSSARGGSDESTIQFIKRIEAEALINEEEAQYWHRMNDDKDSQSLGGYGPRHDADYSREETEKYLFWHPDWPMKHGADEFRQVEKWI